MNWKRYIYLTAPSLLPWWLFVGQPTGLFDQVPVHAKADSPPTARSLTRLNPVAMNRLSCRNRGVDRGVRTISRWVIVEDLSVTPPSLGGRTWLFKLNIPGHQLRQHRSPHGHLPTTCHRCLLTITQIVSITRRRVVEGVHRCAFAGCIFVPPNWAAFFVF
ncbi:hypothetical protein EI94DRAFT_1782312 [Lactarius quietus]|nr:hypothetical protein EI94DRAFT_1782312 [Lactarius quietus]